VNELVIAIETNTSSNKQVMFNDKKWHYTANCNITCNCFHWGSSSNTTTVVVVCFLKQRCAFDG